MESILLAAAVLACPIGMGAMMWFMAKGNRKDKPVAAQSDAEEVRQGERPSVRG